jgi:hypothetical protein
MQFDQLKRREFITLLGGAAGARASRRSFGFDCLPPCLGDPGNGFNGP